MSCSHGVWIGACNICKPVHTSKDQLWNVTYPFSQKDQVPLHSKGQFARECRKLGLVPTTTDDLVKQGTPYHPAREPIPTHRVEPMIREIIQESKSKDRVEQKWRQQEATYGQRAK